MKEDFEKYNPDLIHATDKLKKKTDASTFGQVIINVAIALFSLILLVTRFRETIPIYGISGAVMVVSGINEIITVVRAIREMKRAEKFAKEQADNPAEAKDADNNEQPQPYAYTSELNALKDGRGSLRTGAHKIYFNLGYRLRIIIFIVAPD